MRKAIVIAVLLALVISFVGMPEALAQSEGGQGKKITMWQTLMWGGWIGFTILGLSVVGMGLVIEHAISIRRDALVPPDLLGNLESLFEDEEFEEAMQICETQPTFLTNVLAAGLPKINQGYDEIEKAMQEVGEQEAVRLHQKIGYLSLIANVSPMMGLLGTVAGMIGAFNTIATKQGAANPSDLAGDISKALVTTFLGLTVAIPLTAAFFYFRNRVIRIILEVGAISGEMMERFKTHGKG
ncbi:MAG: MotA/TolQ/ExbB proton channel family protein [Planctomycetota bacterium]|nr:MotA/TolQ/ExbB proton channel family protein [Planctomycetota bacterium]